MSEDSGEGDASFLIELGLRIRMGRLRRRISQDELARMAGVSRVTLGSIERGEHAATVLTYRKLARAFGVALGDLLEEDRGRPRI